MNKILGWARNDPFEHNIVYVRGEFENGHKYWFTFQVTDELSDEVIEQISININNEMKPELIKCAAIIIDLPHTIAYKM
jgi:hypothetical protein